MSSDDDRDNEDEKEREIAMEYRDQVLAYAEAEAVSVLDEIAPEPIRGLARRVYAAVRFQSVLWDWRSLQTGNLLEDMAEEEPEEFFWRLCEFGMWDRGGEGASDPYMIETIDLFMAASPFRQAEVYKMLRNTLDSLSSITGLEKQARMLPIATEHRNLFAANWAFNRAGGPPRTKNDDDRAVVR